jgi:hypothetical protein
VTPDEFLDRVETENRTALSRLGSSKSLYAATGGKMDVQQVLVAAASAEYHAAETYEQWATEDTAETAQTVWRTVVEEEQTHYERVVRELDGDHDPGSPSAIHGYLRDLSLAEARTGGFLGRTLAADRSKSQFTGFFMGQGKTGIASLFRELGADLDDQRDQALDLLGSVCDTGADWDRAATAADGAIQAAYEEYVNTLEEMGVNPKPVC